MNSQEYIMSRGVVKTILNLIDCDMVRYTVYEH